MKIDGEEYVIIDALEHVTVADSFIKENKIGSGNGEARLYVGYGRKELFDFFDNFKTNNECFFCKKDFILFLKDSQQEYYNPQQQYRRIENMQIRYEKYKDKVNSIKDEILKFEIYKYMLDDKNRLYIYGNTKYWTYLREISLPNISYVSVLKLKNKDGKIRYYFRLFIDYKSDVIGYKIPEEKIQEKDIENNKNISPKKKENIMKARIGQGKYREGLLEECPFCPFTKVNDERILVASHIKPWSKANNKEKIDPKNGFMFTPTYDKLFDRGFITFENDKRLIVSPWLSPMNQKRLNIHTGMIINMLPLDEKRMEYLKYHRENVFKS